MKKIVIVGAGISGLFFANLLRQRPEYEVNNFAFFYKKNI